MQRPLVTASTIWAIAIEVRRLIEISEQPVKQRSVRAGRQSQMHICDLACRRGARVDDDDLGAARVPGGGQPLKQDRVTPGKI